MADINKINGKAGAKVRWSNYRGYLISELSKISTKRELDIYQTIGKTSTLQAILLEKRNEKNV